MEAIIQLRMPDEVGVVLTIISNVKELKEVRRQLESCSNRMHWPLSEFTKKVNAAIDAAEMRWDSSIDPPEGKSSSNTELRHGTLPPATG